MKTNTIRYFLTYRGVKLPLCLTEELPADALQHRNTYFRAAFDDQGRLAWLEKLVYGEVEMRHEIRPAWRLGRRAHPHGG